MKGFSKRQVSLTYGFSARYVETLLKCGVLKTLGRGVERASLDNLVEGLHYVVCLECGLRLAFITSKHLRVCTGLSREEYRRKHPGSQLLSSLTKSLKKKTEGQRLKQSQCLKERFKTEAGEATRRQISEASKRLMQTSYRKQAAEHLRQCNDSRREEIASLTRSRWLNPEFRAKMSAEAKERERLYGATTHARGYITRTFSKPHELFEKALIDAGLPGLCREHLIGPFRIDEAIPDLKIAIEVDGCYWHGCEECGYPGHPDTLKTDRRRTGYLAKKGWDLIRVPEHMIRSNITSAVNEVLERVHAKRTRT